MTESATGNQNNIKDLFIEGCCIPQKWQDSFKDTSLANEWGGMEEQVRFVFLRLVDRDEIKETAGKVKKWRNSEDGQDENTQHKIVVFVVLPVFYDTALSFASLRVKKRSSFCDITQALFCAELIPTAGNNEDFANIVTLQDIVKPDKSGKDRIEALRVAVDEVKKKKKWYFDRLQEFYTSFVNFYDEFSLCGKSGWETLKKKLKECDECRMTLNGIDADKPHAVKFEMFRSPIPFVFHDLFWAWQEVRRKIGADGEQKIKFLWIDNKPKDGGKSNELSNIIRETVENFELDVLVETDEEKIGVKTLTDDNNEADDIKSPNFPLSDGQVNQLAELAREYHFILLDFFLDSADTCFAFDLIRQLGQGKKDTNNHSTTWYFIASAVHDSVTRYAQSGLLAEYYESAVVNAGDDPTNEKRQIIFLYKLLTFVHARIKSVRRHYDHVLDRIFFPKKEDCSRKNRHGWGNRCRENEADRCLAGVQQAIKRFLAEDEDFVSLVMDEHKDKRRLMILLDDTITKFNTLPHADWQMVEHQIEAIDARLGDIDDIDGGEFSCGYIIAELKERGNKF